MGGCGELCLRPDARMKADSTETVIHCPDCGRVCTQDHNSFSCHYCQKLWPKGFGWEREAEEKS